jgi:hydroxylamine reductase (hybrid-cluster protein)
VVDQALGMKGFEADAVPAYTTTGFGRNAVLSIADKVIAECIYIDRYMDIRMI